MTEFRKEEIYYRNSHQIKELKLSFSVWEHVGINVCMGEKEKEGEIERGFLFILSFCFWIERPQQIMKIYLSQQISSSKKGITAYLCVYTLYFSPTDPCILTTAKSQ